jgi:TPR repeat protein
MWLWHERERIADWQTAAANGDSDAMLHLAKAAKHHHSEGEAEAERWLRSAADLGNVEAVHKLGVMLLKRGEHEDGEALLHRAALAGHQDAICMMGQLCEKRGDLKGADAWFCQVAADDDES